MIQDHDNDGDGLIDDDPALDFILYEEMTQNDRRQKEGRGGCFGVLLLIVLPGMGLLIFHWNC